MSVEELNQDEELKELKEHADLIGAKYHHMAGKEKVEAAIAEREAEIEAAQEAKKEAKKAAKGGKSKVKIIVESREEGQVDQFFGCGSMVTGERESILIQFGEEVEVSEAMYNHIKSIEFGEKKKKTVLDEDGVPKIEWVTKKKPRFIVSKV